ncbi:hypothetical protein RISK_005757 [Rhodopirellula islandica]|uniref:Uncharacterized protein n=1 Tax=Rhodopirellula islandica TaxID=595434 RepID=A0A0J1B8A8_RHOIS|nr:hypothetical protein RISK_005757 [Rhodopirellula islandica]
MVDRTVNGFFGSFWDHVCARVFGGNSGGINTCFGLISDSSGGVRALFASSQNSDQRKGKQRLSELREHQIHPEKLDWANPDNFDDPPFNSNPIGNVSEHKWTTARPWSSVVDPRLNLARSLFC